MVVNRDSGIIQENPKKYELKSRKRKNSLFFKQFLETKTCVVATVACVCMRVVY
jgi:hypothetical protein